MENLQQRGSTDKVTHCKAFQKQASASHKKPTLEQPGVFLTGLITFAQMGKVEKLK